MKFLVFFIVPVFSYVPFCIHCKHFKRDSIDNKYGKCSLFPRLTEDDYYLVDGLHTKETDYHYCATARVSDKMCKKEGIYFEKK